MWRIFDHEPKGPGTSALNQELLRSLVCSRGTRLQKWLDLNNSCYSLRSKACISFFFHHYFELTVCHKLFASTSDCSDSCTGSHGTCRLVVMVSYPERSFKFLCWVSCACRKSEENNNASHSSSLPPQGAKARAGVSPATYLLTEFPQPMQHEYCFMAWLLSHSLNSVWRDCLEHNLFLSALQRKMSRDIIPYSHCKVGWNLEQSSLVGGVPAHGERSLRSTESSLMSLPAQTVMQFCICTRRMRRQLKVIVFSNYLNCL